ncbi:MAG: short-chain dehydrogenase [Anaerolineaceae bacterium]|nr:short-chain dehydrogenase [Anaerolineaceae bacterium]
MADMRGKVVLVTGATNGIGQVTARELARMGATTVIAGRNAEKLQATVEEIRQQAPDAQVDSLRADLSLMTDVRTLAETFLNRYDRLDVLVNNAGAGASQRHITPEGFERMFALNHLSYFLLTYLLLDKLKASAPARVINVASDAHRSVRLDFDNLQSEHDWGRAGYRAYGRTKLANILFTRELARRLEGTGVTANAVHPGVVATGIWSGAGGIFGRIAGAIAPLVMKTPEQGAQTSIYVASSPEAAGQTGLYFSNGHPVQPAPAAQDDEAARRLWAISAEMVGLAEVATG